MAYFMTDAVNKKLMAGELLALNLGSGPKRGPNSINLDILPSVKPDIVCDLDQERIPLPDNCCKGITLDYVLEHTANTNRILEEVWRVAADKATIFIGVPYCFSSAAFVDPTHKKYFAFESYRYFDSREADNPHYDFQSAFHVVEIQGELEPYDTLTVGLTQKTPAELQDLVYRLRFECNHIRKLNFFMVALKGPERFQRVTSQLELHGFSGERVIVFKVNYKEAEYDKGRPSEPSSTTGEGHREDTPVENAVSQ